MTNISNLICISSIILLSLFFQSYTTPRNENVFTLQSQIIDDQYELYIDLLKHFDTEKPSAITFYTDANLKIGQKIRRQIKNESNEIYLKNVIFVGIRNYRELRK